MPRAGRVLVVDDEVNARTALAELLRDKGYEVEMAADAFKAIGKFESFAPHVVVTDLKMPGMDGIELIKKLRAEADPPAVVVMTAFGAVETAVDAMRAGAADYLSKPINLSELLVVLDRVLETEQLRRETRQLRARVRDRVAPLLRPAVRLLGILPHKMLEEFPSLRRNRHGEFLRGMKLQPIAGIAKGADFPGEGLDGVGSHAVEDARERACVREMVSGSCALLPVR